MWKIPSVLLVCMLHLHIPGCNSKPRVPRSTDEDICFLYTQENCNVPDIKNACPNLCETTKNPTNDPGPCKLFTQKECQDPAIKADCPNTCKSTIDTTTIKSTTIIQPTYTNLDLWTAARDGNLAEVKKILSQNVDINWQNKNHLGYSALHIASKNNHLAIMNLLLEKGANKDMRDDSGLTSIFHASNEGHIDALSTLIKSGAKVDLGTDDNYTPLMQSSGKGFYDIVKKLIDADSDVNLANKWGWTALHDAAQFNRIEVAELLFLKGANAKKEGNDGQTPSDKAHKQGYYQLEKILQGYAGSRDVQNAEPVLSVRTVGNNFIEMDLWNASRDGNLAYVKVGIAKGINPNWKNNDHQGQTSLHIAALNNHPSIMAVLMDNGADKDMTDNRGFTPLFTAADRGSKEAVFTLIKYKAYVDKGTSSSFTPLMQAAGKGYFSIVEALIDAKADVNRQNKDGHTAFSTAAAYNRFTIVQLLFRNGADPKTKDIDDWTPAVQARHRGYNDLAIIIDGYTSVTNG